MKIALISCTKRKENKPCFASEMYMPSQLFKKARKYTGQRYKYWFILSAEYGLLRPTQWIYPYNKTLNNMSANEIKEWSTLVFNDIKTLNVNEVDFYAGEKYRIYIIPMLEAEGITCNVPLKGLGIGQQLQFYKENE